MHYKLTKTHLPTCRMFQGLIEITLGSGDDKEFILLPAVCIRSATVTRLEDEKGRLSWHLVVYVLEDQEYRLACLSQKQAADLYSDLMAHYCACLVALGMSGPCVDVRPASEALAVLARCVNPAERT